MKPVDYSTLSKKLLGWLQNDQGELLTKSLAEVNELFSGDLEVLSITASWGRNPIGRIGARLFKNTTIKAGTETEDLSSTTATEELKTLIDRYNEQLKNDGLKSLSHMYRETPSTARWLLGLPRSKRSEGLRLQMRNTLNANQPDDESETFLDDKMNAFYPILLRRYFPDVQNLNPGADGLSEINVSYNLRYLPIYGLGANDALEFSFQLIFAVSYNCKEGTKAAYFEFQHTTSMIAATVAAYLVKFDEHLRDLHAQIRTIESRSIQHNLGNLLSFSSVSESLSGSILYYFGKRIRYTASRPLSGEPLKSVRLPLATIADDIQRSTEIFKTLFRSRSDHARTSFNLSDSIGSRCAIYARDSSSASAIVLCIIENLTRNLSKHGDTGRITNAGARIHISTNSDCSEFAFEVSPQTRDDFRNISDNFCEIATRSKTVSFDTGRRGLTEILIAGLDLQGLSPDDLLYGGMLKWEQSDSVASMFVANRSRDCKPIVHLSFNEEKQSCTYTLACRPYREEFQVLTRLGSDYPASDYYRCGDTDLIEDVRKNVPLALAYTDGETPRDVLEKGLSNVRVLLPDTIRRAEQWDESLFADLSDIGEGSVLRLHGRWVVCVHDIGPNLTSFLEEKKLDFLPFCRATVGSIVLFPFRDEISLFKDSVIDISRRPDAFRYLHHLRQRILVVDESLHELIGTFGIRVDFRKKVYSACGLEENFKNHWLLQGVLICTLPEEMTDERLAWMVEQQFDLVVMHDGLGKSRSDGERFRKFARTASRSATVIICSNGESFETLRGESAYCLNKGGLWDAIGSGNKLDLVDCLLSARKRPETSGEK